MRQLRGVLSVAVLMLALLEWAAPAAAEASHLRSSCPAWTAANLNLRSGPSTSYPISRVIPKGARISVLSSVSGTHWYRATYDGTTGYVSGNYLAGASSYTDPVRPASSTSYDACHHDYPASDIFAPIGSQLSQ